MTARTVLVAALVSGLAAAVALAAPAMSFRGLGPWGDLDSWTSVAGVSADGTVVVGCGYTAPRYYALRWTAPDGWQYLPSPGGAVDTTEAAAASANGAVIVGSGFASTTGLQEALRWEGDTVQGLGRLAAGDTASWGRGVSADGSVVVGWSTGPGGAQAFRWTAAGGMQPLAGLSDRYTMSWASGISADGSTVIGWGENAHGTEPFRWTAAGGVQPLDRLPPDDHNAYAYAVSADGSVVAGSGQTDVRSLPTRWEADGTVEAFGYLHPDLGPPSTNSGTSVAVSADGSVVVGYAASATDDSAFVWDAAHGLRDLRDVLALGGVDPSGWRLGGATGVSADGLTIVGNGYDGNFAWSWIAVIPEPATLSLLAVGALAVTGRRASARRRQGRTA